MLPKVSAAGPPGDKVLHWRDPFDPNCYGCVPAPVLQQGMPDSAWKDKMVIDPREEKKEPVARDRCTNWKNATFMLLPKSIVTTRSCCSCRLFVRLWVSLRSGEGFGYSCVQESTCKLCMKGEARWRKTKPSRISYACK